MGTGQSKVFRRNDRDYRSQYPFGPPSGYPYPQQMQPFMPNYVPNGYPTGPMFPQPQGFIPPENYGQGRFLPPPQLNWLPQDRQRKKRKSRRTQSEQFVGGFQPGAATGGQPHPQQRHESRSRRAQSESHQRDDPEPRHTRNATNRSENRRAATPFIPPASGDREDDRDEDRPRSGSEHNRVPSRHSVRYPTPPPIRAEFSNVIEPLEPASAAAFGPTGPRPRTPLSNPLPPPPRDLYEMTPYKSLLTLPQTTALLTATYGPQASGGGQLGIQPSAQKKKTGKSGGLFRAFSKRGKNELDAGQTQTQFIPVFVPSTTPDETRPSTQATLSNLARSQSQQTRVTSFAPMPTTPNTGGLRNAQASPHSAHTHTSGDRSSSQHSAEPIPPVPPMPTTAPTLHFDQKSLFNMFLTHSPHRVLYMGKTYPTALHLHEALKFIDYRPDIAELIRNAPVTEVYPLAARFQGDVRPDWNSKFIEFMIEVLKLKFTQHPDLRSTLLGTGTALIVYDDPSDAFWGSGPDRNGQNELGRLLVHIREILRAETAGM